MQKSPAVPGTIGYGNLPGWLSGGYRRILVYCANARPDARSFVMCIDLGPAY